MEVSDERILHLETDVSSIRAEVADAKAQSKEAMAEIRSMHRALDDIKQRIQAPKIGVQITIAGTIAVVLLSIVTLALAPVYANIERIVSAVSEHMDGHPESVRGDITRIFQIIQDEHDEQEHDIEQLRAVADGFEKRCDDQDQRIARLETTIGERTEWVKEFVSLRSADRWTGAQQREYEKRQEHVTEQMLHEHDRLEDRIRALENNGKQ